VRLRRSGRGERCSNSGLGLSWEKAIVVFEILSRGFLCDIYIKIPLCFSVIFWFIVMTLLYVRPEYLDAFHPSVFELFIFLSICTCA
jgi:hypothetical protein